jgi:replicative DNA helicase
VESQRIEAERALLGAILLDPAGQEHVHDFVQPADYLRPWHAQVHEAIGRARRQGALPSAQEVYAELRADPDLPTEVALDGVLVADLMSAAPRASHAPAYAVAVVENGIRQRLWIAGSRVRQAASSGDLHYALDQARVARQEIRACAARWTGLPEHWRHELPRPAAGQARQAAAWRPRGPEAEAAGARLLRELAADPGQFARISDWLRPEHFTRPRHGQVYAVIGEMATAGLPADAVTISREAARCSVRIPCSELTGGTGALAEGSARQLYARAVLAQVSQAGTDLQTGAASPHSSVSGLLDLAARRLDHSDGGWQPEPWLSARSEWAREREAEP